mgnify:CR=1 FL=1
MQEELRKALKIEGVRWCLLIGPEGVREAAGSCPDALAQGTLAAMSLALRETARELALGEMSDCWLCAEKIILCLVAADDMLMLLGVDAARANIGLVRVHARKVMGQIARANDVR